jgi:HlyD family secretion protein
MSIGPKTGWRNTVAMGTLGIVLLGLLLGGWISQASIAGAVIAPGSVVVRGKPKSIQHLDGGIVSEILVRNGDRVSTGTPMIRLDDATIRANLAIYRNRLKEALAREARLHAELREDEEIGLADVREVPHDIGDLDTSLATQAGLLEARRNLRTGKREQLAEQIAQHENQIIGVRGLIDAREEQLRLIEKELSASREMREQGFVPEREVTALERQRADLRGLLAEDRAELARVHNAIGERRIELLQVGHEHQESVLKELRATASEIDELLQQIQATEAQLSRVEIVAPTTGIVHELALHTIGGVVQPGGTVLQIIPVEEGVEVELTVPTSAIDQVFLGQEARVRFPAFNQRTTPDVAGQVSMVSASSVIDEQSGSAFYRVNIDLSQEELAKLGSRQLTPGMPAEGFLLTDLRTVLDYLIRPVTDYFVKAFRER